MDVKRPACRPDEVAARAAPPAHPGSGHRPEPRVTTEPEHEATRGHTVLPIPIDSDGEQIATASSQQLADAFRKAVATFAKRRGIPIIPFAKDTRKIEAIKPYFEAAKRPGVVGQRVRLVCRPRSPAGHL